MNKTGKIVINNSYNSSNDQIAEVDDLSYRCEAIAIDLKAKDVPVRVTLARPEQTNLCEVNVSGKKYHGNHLEVKAENLTDDVSKGYDVTVIKLNGVSIEARSIDILMDTTMQATIVVPLSSIDLRIDNAVVDII